MIRNSKSRLFRRGAATLGFVLLMNVAVRADMAPVTSKETPTIIPSVIPCSLWLTGQVFVRHGLLLFRSDVPVRTDNGENVVFLGATRRFAQDLLPEYIKAAANRTKVRLYGALMISGPLQGLRDEAPPVEFVTWALHKPTARDTIQPNPTTPLTSTSIASFPDDGTYASLSSMAIPLHDTLSQRQQ